MRIETERLLIRSFAHGDIPRYAAIVADPRVTKHLRRWEPHSYEEARWYVEDCIAREAATGVARYALLSGDELIGFCGFKVVGDEVDLGWRYAHAHWGRGYASEAAPAVLHYGSTALGLRGITAHAFEANVASVRVIEKLGFELVDRVEDPRGTILRYAQPDSA